MLKIQTVNPCPPSNAVNPCPCEPFQCPSYIGLYLDFTFMDVLSNLICFADSKRMTRQYRTHNLSHCKRIEAKNRRQTIDVEGEFANDGQMFVKSAQIFHDWQAFVLIDEDRRNVLIVSFQAVTAVRRRKPKRIGSSDIPKRRRLLISFLIFSIPFNLINFIVFCTFCRVPLILFYEHTYVPASMIITTVCALFRGGACALVGSINMLTFLFFQVSMDKGEYRTILISVFILFGLKQCRDAMRDLFARKTTKVTAVANNMIADVTAQFERQAVRDSQMWSYQAGGIDSNVCSASVRR
uniref:7TM_GPCR_Srx domain-containing protein n=1 Tax=Ascaris lumbricoides TaxID=6252 RepID=A0A0M3HXE4_ASCLU